MALDTNDLTALSDAFFNALQRSANRAVGGGGAGGDEGIGVSKLDLKRAATNQKKRDEQRRVDDLRRSKDEKGLANSILNLNRRMSQTSAEYKHASDQSYHASQLLKAAAEKASDFGSFEKSITSTFKSVLEQSGMHEFANSIKTLEDVYRTEGSMQSLDALNQTLIDANDLSALNSDQLLELGNFLRENKGGLNPTLRKVIDEVNAEFIRTGDISHELNDMLIEELGHSIPEVTKKVTEELGKLSNALATSAKEVQYGFKGMGNNIRNQLQKFRETVTDANVGMGLLVKGLTQTYNDFKGAIKTGDVGKFGERVDQALSMGIDPAALSELSATNRQAALASGGMAQYMDRIAGVQKDWYRLTGDNLDAARQAMIAEGVLRQVGVKNQTDLNTGMIDYNKNVTRLMKITGMTADQVNQMNQEIVQNNEHRSIMARMDVKSRQLYVLETQNRIAANIALGMLPDQAKKVEDTFAAMTKASPVERIKKAAKVQAMMGAMGIGGGARAAELMRKGKLGAGEKTELQGLLSSASNQMSDMMGGTMGQQIFAGALQDKMGIGELIGEDSPMNTKLVEGNAISEKIEKNTALMADTYSTETTGARLLDKTIQNVLHNPLLSMIAGVGIISAHLVLTNVLLTTIAKQGGMSGLGDMLSGKKLGKLAKFGGIGAGVLAGGFKAAEMYGRDDLSFGQKATQTATTGAGAGLGMWGGAAAGAALGTMLLPGIGTAIGGLAGGALGAWGGGELGSYAGEGISGMMSGKQPSVDMVRDEETTMQQQENQKLTAINTQQLLKKQDESNSWLADISAKIGDGNETSKRIGNAQIKVTKDASRVGAIVQA